MKKNFKIFVAFLTVLISLQLQALPMHLTNHHDNFFQQQQPKKNQKDAKVHANSNSIIGSNNAKNDHLNNDKPKNAELKNTEKEKGNKKKK